MAFRSQAQRRFMFAAADRGEVPKATPHEWAAKTKDMKELPEHVKRVEHAKSKLSKR